jgi:3-oxoacyl-[acyl-carrier protein] reductase
VRSLTLRADVSKSGEVAQMVDYVCGELGPILILVNNAGIVDNRRLEQIGEEDWNRVLAVNLKSLFWPPRPCFKERIGKINCLMAAAFVG